MSEILSDIERKSAVWLKLKAHLEERLENHRSKNDGDLSGDLTAKTRGRIAEIKELLKLGEPQQKIEAEPHID